MSELTLILLVMCTTLTIALIAAIFVGTRESYQDKVQREMQELLEEFLENTEKDNEN